MKAAGERKLHLEDCACHGGFVVRGPLCQEGQDG